jgi:hypothetical protein
LRRGLRAINPAAGKQFRFALGRKRSRFPVPLQAGRLDGVDGSRIRNLNGMKQAQFRASEREGEEGNE